jgi:PhnB protein
MPVRPIPEGYHALTPYLIVHDATAALAWYVSALGAQELYRVPGPDGKIGHSELQLGDSRFMLADEVPAAMAKSARTYGGSAMNLLLYVEDVDARFAQAVAAGAKAVRPVVDQFYGDRSGSLEDPFGFFWTLATHVEDLSPEEIMRRAQNAHA